MANHYVHYIKRKVVLRYPKDPKSEWFAELEEYKDDFNKPIYHVTSSCKFPVDEIKRGDVIWLVGQLQSKWGRLPPSLDAKLVVVGEPNRSGKQTRFYAGQGSCWFSLRDASELFESIQPISTSGNPITRYQVDKNNLGSVYQSIRKINAPKLLMDWQVLLNTQPYDFISYRLKDGTEQAFEQTKKLMETGKSVFWDRWSLPRRLAERRALVSGQALDKLLASKIGEAQTVWGVESELYNQADSYSRIEKEIAVSLGKYRAI